MTTRLKPARVTMPKTRGTGAGPYHQVRADRVMKAYGITPNAGRGQTSKLPSLKVTGYGKVGRPFR